MAQRKSDKPISVRRYRSEGHRLETRVFQRDIHETFCVDPRCKFKGKRAAQGVCFTKDTLTGFPHKAFEIAEQRAQDALRETREVYQMNRRRIKNFPSWVTYLEHHFISDQMNGNFRLDELIRLRAENARLLLKAGKYK